MRAFRGRFDHLPDVVAHPGDEAELESVLDWCEQSGAAAIPFGGGTSVVGGVEAAVGEGFAGVVTIDLKRLDRVLDVDPVSQAARIQAGVTGPRLEEQLREHGLTLRHYPQSFEYSTLGGWIATRAGGHFATLGTHIDDYVESVRALTPRGVWESRRLPGSGAGPSPDRMLIGSEGILGVITEAWMRVRERPRFKASAGVTFDSFAAGAAAVRALAQSGLHPSNCRLLDPGEAGLTGAAPAGRALLVLGFESADHPLDAWMARAAELCRDHGGELPDEPRVGGRDGASDAWRDAFLQMPYLRDTLIAGGIFAETFETAVTWDRLTAFVEDVRERTLVGARRGHRQLPADARLPGWGGALLHRARAGPARRRAGAVGRGQGGRLGGDHRRGRDDHAPPRRRSRSPALVRPAAPGAVRRRARGGQGRGRPGRHPQPRGADRALTRLPP